MVNSSFQLCIQNSRRTWCSSDVLYFLKFCPGTSLLIIERIFFSMLFFIWNRDTNVNGTKTRDKKKKILPPCSKRVLSEPYSQKIVFLRYMQDPEKIHGRRQHNDRAYQPRARQSILLFILTLSDCIKELLSLPTPQARSEQNRMFLCEIFLMGG
jgi:hypothetical protein